VRVGSKQEWRLFDPADRIDARDPISGEFESREWMMSLEENN
jgi:hypothetical protein